MHVETKSKTQQNFLMTIYLSAHKLSRDTRTTRLVYEVAQVRSECATGSVRERVHTRSN